MIYGPDNKIAYSYTDENTQPILADENTLNKTRMPELVRLGIAHVALPVLANIEVLCVEKARQIARDNLNPLSKPSQLRIGEAS